MDMHLSENVKLLITAVQTRPVIWDKSLPDYRDRIKVKTAWREVCCELKEDFNKIDDAAKNCFSSLLLKRWTNIRDAYRRQKKQLKEPASNVDTPRKYLFSENLRFLDKVFDDSATDDPPLLPDAPDTPEEEISQFTLPPPHFLYENAPTSKKRKMDEVDQKILAALEQDENPHLCFFKGLLPLVRDFCDEETIEMQMGMLSIIRSIKSRRQNPSAHSQNHLPYYQPFQHEFTIQHQCNVTMEPSDHSGPLGISPTHSSVPSGASTPESQILTTFKEEIRDSS